MNLSIVGDTQSKAPDITPAAVFDMVMGTGLGAGQLITPIPMKVIYDALTTLKAEDLTAMGYGAIGLGAAAIFSIPIAKLIEVIAAKLTRDDLDSFVNWVLTFDDWGDMIDALRSDAKFLDAVLVKFFPGLSIYTSQLDAILDKVADTFQGFRGNLLLLKKLAKWVPGLNAKVDVSRRRSSD